MRRLLVLAFCFLLAGCVNVSPEENLKDCGNDLECFKATFDDCEKAVVHYANNSSEDEEMVVEFKATGKNLGRAEDESGCIFYYNIDEVNVVTSNPFAALFLPFLQSFENKSMNCTIPEGQYPHLSGPIMDVSGTDCSGDLYDILAGMENMSGGEFEMGFGETPECTDVSLRLKRQPQPEIQQEAGMEDFPYELTGEEINNSVDFGDWELVLETDYVGGGKKVPSLDCRYGEDEGENLNNLYCTPGYYSKISKKEVDSKGNIVEKKEYYYGFVLTPAGSEWTVEEAWIYYHSNYFDPDCKITQ